MTTRIKRLTAVFAVIIYIIACFSKAYLGESGRADMFGFAAIAFGPMALFYSFYAFTAWLANITFFTCLILNLLNRANKTTASLGLISFLFSFCSLFVKRLLINEAGANEAVIPGSGAYLWIFSMFIMLIASLIPVKRNSAAAINA